MYYAYIEYDRDIGIKTNELQELADRYDADVSESYRAGDYRANTANEFKTRQGARSFAKDAGKMIGRRHLGAILVERMDKD